MTEHNEHQTFKADKIPCQKICDPAVLLKNPLVSVHMITYNYEHYIAQAIEAVLMQETDFPIELVIDEVCSTDRTREIAFDYQKKYPDMIRVIISDENVGVIKNKFENRKSVQWGIYCVLRKGRLLDRPEKITDAGRFFLGESDWNAQGANPKLNILTARSSGSSAS